MILAQDMGYQPVYLPGVEAWLEGDISPFTLNVGKISQIDDIGPNASNHGVQATDTDQPPPSTLKGKRCWTGDGISDFLTIADAASLRPGAGDFTLIAVVRSDSNSAAQRIAMKGRSGGSGAAFKRYDCLINGTPDEDPTIGIDDDVADKTIAGTTSMFNNTRVLMTGRDGTDLRLFIDGVEETGSPLDIGAYGSIDSSPLTDVFIGKVALASGTVFSGKYAVWLFFKRFVSVAEVTPLISHYISKWV